jgi:hypothetical protein
VRRIELRQALTSPKFACGLAAMQAGLVNAIGERRIPVAAIRKVPQQRQSKDCLWQRKQTWIAGAYGVVVFADRST